MFSVQKATQKGIYNSYSVDTTAFSGGNFLQSWEWGVFLQEKKEKVVRIIIKKENDVIGRATFTLQKRLSLYSFAYTPFGPELDYTNLEKDELKKVFEEVQNFLRKKGCVFLRIQPPLEKTYELNIPNLLETQAKTKQPDKTIYLDLTKEEELLLKEMKPKTRYNIRLAEKKGLTIKNQTNPKTIKSFIKLAEITSQRTDFNLHTKKYYTMMINSLSQAGLLQVYTAYYNNFPIAANLVLSYNNTATYLHGATSNEHRNLMPAYLLQWQAILDAKQRGLLYYDFWGIDEKKWPGVTRFKKGFNGKTIAFHSTYEIPLMSTRYLMLRKLRQFTGK